MNESRRELVMAICGVNGHWSVGPLSYFFNIFLRFFLAIHALSLQGQPNHHLSEFRTRVIHLISPDGRIFLVV